MENRLRFAKSHANCNARIVWAESLPLATLASELPHEYCTLPH